MNPFRATIIALIVLIASCSGNGNAAQKSPDTTAQANRKPNIDVPVHRQYNDAARFIAGLPVDSASTFMPLEKNDAFTSYVSQFTNDWNRFDSERIAPIANWRQTELPAMKGENDVLFYPFSGPDFLYATTFFPDADTTIMIGLEPTGKLPSASEVQEVGVAKYLDKVNTSLESFLNYSFFRTIAMRNDLTSQDLNGVIHLVSLFMVKTGHTILDVQHITVDEKGNVVDWTNDVKGKTNDGLKIYYSGKDPYHVQVLYYFSTDLSNGVFAKNEALKDFLEKFPKWNTYLKSASYLMHEAYFSDVRSFILNRSYRILQDDSGIPYMYFSKAGFNLTLYGSYSKPIPLFKNKYQQDLFDAYQNKQNVKPLPFGIGYVYLKNESNMQLAVKTAQ
jgi:hypothetical protein